MIADNRETAALVTLADVRRLLAEGLPDEACRLLEARDTWAEPEVQALCRLVVRLALRQGRRALASAAAAHLAGDVVPESQALRVAAELAPEKRMAGLLQLARRVDAPAYAGWAARVAAAELALAGRGPEALEVLAGMPSAGDGAVLRALLLFVAGRPGDALEVRCDWRRLASVLASEGCGPLPLPAPIEAGPAEARAAYYLEHGDLPRAYEVLAIRQREVPEDYALARNLAVIAYLRCAESSWGEPRLVEDCIAQFAFCLYNNRAMEAWALGRLKVHGVRDDERAVCDHLRVEVERKLDEDLARLPVADGAPARYRLLLAWECRAAAALRAAGADLAFGPLFMRRANVSDRLVALLGRLGEGSGQDEPDQRMLDLARRLGLDEAMTRALAGGQRPEVDAIRLWFSEIGQARALVDRSAAAEACAEALRVYARWSPPGEPDRAVFDAENPGLAALSDGPGQLRRAAAAVICDMEVQAAREGFASPDVDARTLRRMVRHAVERGAAFGREAAVRRQLRDAVMSRTALTMERPDLEALDRACLVLQTADECGLEILPEVRAGVFMKRGGVLVQRKQWRRAIESYEQALACDTRRAGIPCSMVAIMLKWFEVLRDDHRPDEAARVLARAREIAAETGERFPDQQEVQNMQLALTLVAAGTPTEELLNLPDAGKEEVPPPVSQLPAAVIALLKECRQARSAGDLRQAQAAADAAMTELPGHPDTVALAASTSLDLARTLSPADGANLFARVGQYLEPARARFGGHDRLQAVGTLYDRDRALYQTDGPLADLHAKAVRLALAARHVEAIEPLRIVLALSARREIAPVVLLCECLLEKAQEGDRDALNQAESWLAIGRELAPEYSGLERVRERLSDVKGGAA